MTSGTNQGDADRRGPGHAWRLRALLAVSATCLLALSSGCGFIGLIPLAAGIGIGLSAGGEDKEVEEPEPTDPLVSGVSPGVGLASGGTTVDVYGKRFQSTATVRFGADFASNQVYHSSTWITCTAPSHAEGTVDVVVLHLDGQSGTLAGAFRFDGSPPADVTSFSASFSGTDINVSWSNPDPMDPDFAGVMVRRGVGSAPSYPANGVLAYEGTGTSFVDTGLAPGFTYFYTAFAFDLARNYSSGVSDSIHMNAPPVVTAYGPVSSNQAPGGRVLFTASATDVEGPVTTFLIDLSPIGGLAAQPMYDDGSNGDLKINDGIYSFEAQIDGSTAPGQKTLTVTARDSTSAPSTANAALLVGSILFDHPNARIDRAVSGDATAPRLACCGRDVYAAWLDIRGTSAKAVYFNASHDGGTSWDPTDKMISSGAASSDASSVEIACSGDNVYVVWNQRMSTFMDVCFACSTNGGANWSSPAAIDVSAGMDAWMPAICCEGIEVYAVWMETPSNLVFRKSPDGGATWNPIASVSGPAAIPYVPRIACCGDNIYVTWFGWVSDYNVYFNWSDDAGGSWAGEQRIDRDTTGTAYSVYPQICCEGSNVCVVWHDSRNGKYDIYCNLSSDEGSTWLASDVRLDTDAAGSGDSANPRIVSSGNRVYVAWEDYRAGAQDVRFNTSADFGSTWLASDVRLDTDAAGAAVSTSARIACSGEMVYAVWRDFRDSANGDIRFNFSSDAGASWLDSDLRLRVAAPNSASDSPDICCTGNDAFIAWEDRRSGTMDVMVEHAKYLWTGTAGSSDARLDLSTNNYNSYSPQIACCGDDVYVAWREFTAGPSDGVYFNKSNDAGLTWLNQKLKINSISGSCNEARIACSGSTVYVAWVNSNGNIYLQRSLDRGATWISAGEVQVNTGSNSCQEMYMTCSGDCVYVVFIVDVGGNREVWFQASHDAGSSWLAADIRLDSAAVGGVNTQLPRLACTGRCVYAVWEDGRAAIRHVYAATSLNSGKTWFSDICLDTGAWGAFMPSVSCTGGHVYAAWWDARPAGTYTNVFFKSSFNCGFSWNSEVQLESANLSSYNQLIHSIGTQVAVTWQRLGTQSDIYFNRSLNSGGSWLSSSKHIDTDSTGSFDSIYPTSSMSGNSIFVAWSDGRNGTYYDIYLTYSTDVGGTWLSTEIRLDTDTAGAADSGAAAVASWGNKAYVAWADLRNSLNDIYFNRVR